MGDIINFKGISDGVYIETESKDKNLILKKIDLKVRKSKSFFKGTKIIGISNNGLSISDKLDIIYALKYKYGFEVSLEDLFEDEKLNIKNKLKQEIEEEKKIEIAQIRKDQKVKEEKLLEDCRKLETHTLDEGMTKFVYGTLRSGQEVDFDGNIVVVGDVNPGAFLKAQGNIVVLGRLNGIAYAGLNGNKKAIVAAYNLLPSQMRIANMIVRAPDNDKSKLKIPEVAKIVGDEVIIEPYLPNK